jgi:predicted MPP superfamily phosphohydrolase
MSLDWHWPVVLALLIPPAVGHLYHFVLLVNWESGLGYREPAMDKIRDFGLGLFLLSSGLLFFLHLHSPWWTWSNPLWGYAVLCTISGAFVFPFNSWRVMHRRRPGGIAGSRKTVDLARQAGTTSLIGRGRGRRLLMLPGNQSFQLQIHEWEVSFADLPPQLEGLRIVQLSDLHLGPCYERRFFEAIVDACQGWSADLIVMTGDLVEDDATISWVEPLLRPLKARLAKFAILGNHDNEHHPKKIAHELDRAGFELLEGRWTTLDLDGTTLAVGGTSQPWGPAINPREMPAASFHLLLSHSPDLFYKATRWGVDLMLSGHNHGGQIRLPLVGPIFMPSRYSRRFDRGFFRRNGTLLYVNEGVGGKHPVRYGCPPEVSQIVLRGVKAGLEIAGRNARGGKRRFTTKDLAAN